MPENRWHIESKMREMSPKRVTLPTLHGFRLQFDVVLCRAKDNVAHVEGTSGTRPDATSISS